MGIFKLASDTRFEAEGVWLDLGDFRWRIARMGGNNKAFKQAFEKKIKPIRKAYELGLVPDEKQVEIVQEALAESIILDAEVKRDGKWVRGLDVEGDEKAVQPFTKDAVEAILKDPRMVSFFQTVLSFATDSRPYAAVITTADETKN